MSFSLFRKGKKRGGGGRIIDTKDEEEVDMKQTNSLQWRRLPEAQWVRLSRRVSCGQADLPPLLEGEGSILVRLSGLFSLLMFVSCVFN